MKSDKLVPGLVLVVIGAAILLANFGYLEFHWENFERLWPIFIVMIGVNLVLSHNKTPWAIILRIAVVLVGLSVLLFGNFDRGYSSRHHGHFFISTNDNDDNNNDNDNDDDGDNNDSGTQKFAVKGTFNEPFTSAIKVARLNISGGATGYHLSDTTNQLFSANTSKETGKYNFFTSTDDSVHVMDFSMKDHFGFHFGPNDNKIEFKLNPNPVWEINVETGASGLDFDLTKFKVRELKIHGGAAGFNIKMGAPQAITDINVSTGVSGVDISIPKGAACSVDTDSGLSGNDFDEVPKISDDHYQTAGYDDAKTKFYIHIKGGLSGFHVKRY